jgi:hypothetical protein
MIHDVRAHHDHGCVTAPNPTNKVSTMAACAARGPTALGSDSAVVDDGLMM